MHRTNGRIQGPMFGLQLGQARTNLTVGFQVAPSALP